MLETAYHHALNGFECVLGDMKGHGLASGYRGTNWGVEDWQEQIGVLLQKVRVDKPLFVMGHSMGCLAFINFYLKNKGN